MGCFIPGNPRECEITGHFGTYFLPRFMALKPNYHDRNVPPLDLLLSQINLITILIYFLEDPTSLATLQITRDCIIIHDLPAI
jgi:hypothetical protein